MGFFFTTFYLVPEGSEKQCCTNQIFKCQIKKLWRENQSFLWCILTSLISLFLGVCQPTNGYTQFELFLLVALEGEGSVRSFARGCGSNAPPGLQSGNLIDCVDEDARGRQTCYTFCEGDRCNDGDGSKEEWEETQKTTAVPETGTTRKPRTGPKPFGGKPAGACATMDLRLSCVLIVLMVSLMFQGAWK